MKREAHATTTPARRQFTAEFRRQVVEQTLAPGVSISKIAMDHRLNANLVFTWRRRHLRQMAGAVPAPKMLPVMVESSPVLDSKPRAVAASVIEIELSAGRIRLKGPVDIESLRAVVDLLSRR